MNLQSDFVKNQSLSEFSFETTSTGVLLAFSGGFQDAYTYIVRDHVFANAQTGNVVLMSTHLLSGNFSTSVGYLLPILAFLAGVFAAVRIEARWNRFFNNNPGEIILLLEILVLFFVGLLPPEHTHIANMLVSFSCAMQVQSFRLFRGHPFSSTMCIGNLRSCMASFAEYTLSHDVKKLKAALCYVLILCIFALGAGIGGILSMRYGIRSIWISCLVLLYTFLNTAHRMKRELSAAP